MFEVFRHYSRYVVNGAALGLIVLTSPEFGAFVPGSSAPKIAAIVAVLNTVLSLLRR